MTISSIILVHGTGVRLNEYNNMFRSAEESAKQAGVSANFTPCAWGDPLGVSFTGLCLPDPPDAATRLAEAADHYRWQWLLTDPLAELELLTIPHVPNIQAPLPFGQREPWRIEWTRITDYKLTSELKLLLQREALETLWTRAWTEVTVNSIIAEKAFEQSAHELPNAAAALARAVVAQIHVLATDDGRAGPSRALRAALVDRLLSDWNCHVLGGGFLLGMAKRAATRFVRHHRHRLFSDVAFMAGDILLYQSRGEEIRTFLREKVELAHRSGPVTLVAHSLGGIAGFDLLAMPDPPPVARLVTIGSQVPLLYELGALASLRPSQSIPKGFPPWLNIFDRNDALSFVANRLFPGARDIEAVSGQPFPDSHSAYFGNSQMWQAIKDFLP